MIWSSTYGPHTQLDGVEDEIWRGRWIDFEEEFHRTIAKCSGNPLLCKDISRYRLLLRSLNQLSATVEALGQSVAEHAQILKALEARNGVRARALMEEHIAAWQMYFLDILPR